MNRCGTDASAALELPSPRNPVLLDQLRLRETKYRKEYDHWDYYVNRPVCWGGRTWVLARFSTPGDDGGADSVVIAPRRVCSLREGDEVFTGHRGEFRRVQRVVRTLHTSSSAASSGAEIARYRGVWITSHHPVLHGAHWRYPGDVTDEVFRAHEVAERIGHVYNLELEGALCVNVCACVRVCACVCLSARACVCVAGSRVRPAC
jgi:hypothetical protein